MTLSRRDDIAHPLATLLSEHLPALHLLQSGVDITVIALWLGHENPSTTASAVPTLRASGPSYNFLAHKISSLNMRVRDDHFTLQINCNRDPHMSVRKLRTDGYSLGNRKSWS